MLEFSINFVFFVFSGKMTFNPWNVDSLEAFTFFCCPECDYKSRTSRSFEGHALKNHPMSYTYFGGREDYEDTDDKSKLYFDDYDEKMEDSDMPENYIKSEPMEDYDLPGPDVVKTEDDSYNKPFKSSKKKKLQASHFSSSTCLVCQEDFPSSILMKRHRKSEHPGDVQCKTCHKKFSSYNLLSNHSRNGKCDSKGEPSTCLVCQETITNVIHQELSVSFVLKHLLLQQCIYCDLEMPLNSSLTG